MPECTGPKAGPLLSIAFCPPAEYLSVLSSGPVRLEACEKYCKQSWRNRLRYLAADGPRDFSFPVVHDRSTLPPVPGTNPGSESPGAHTTLITDIRVDYSTPWVRNLRRAITTAYSSAAYFPYFCDDFFAVLESRPERLWDLDMAMLNFLCRSFGFKAQITLTTSYRQSPLPQDLRSAFHPKRPLPAGIPAVKPYFQVFSPRLGFTPGLSAIDLLFNEGPHALIVGL